MRTRSRKGRGRQTSTQRKRKKKRQRRAGGKNKRKALPENPETNFTISGAQWRTDTGATAARERTVRRQKAHIVRIDGEPPTTLYDVLREKPTGRRGTTEGLIAHCQYLSKYWDHIMGFATKPKTKRHRFDRYLHQRAAMDRLCRRVTRGHDPEKVVVFLGAAQCNRGFGYGPSPVKGFRRHLARYAKVIVIHEHYTSQRCSICAFTDKWSDQRPDKHTKLKPGRDRQDAGKEQVHGVRYCPECKITHHRDVNSARNMRQLGVHICIHRERADPFHHEGAYNN